MRRTLPVAFAAALTFAALAGPPMLCHEFDVGKQTCVSMEKVAKKEVAKTLVEALDASRDPLVHMETIRRSVNTGRFDSATFQASYAALSARVLDAEAEGEAGSELWFDLGWFVATVSQHSGELPFAAGRDKKVDGYAYMKKAIAGAKAAKDDRLAAYNFAAAVMMHPAMRHADRKSDNPGLGSDVYDRHLRSAVADATPGSALERNLESHVKNWGGSIDRIRAAAKKERAENRQADARTNG